MNKELEGVIEDYNTLKRNKNTITNIEPDYLFELVDILLNYIENSIPKEKVKEKIEELSNTKGDFATYIATSERIKVLQELLEEK